MMAESSDRGDVAVLVSGGVDSAILCVDLLREFREVHPIYVRFGLRWEDVELERLREFLDRVATQIPGISRLTILDEPVADVYGDHWSTLGQSGVPDSESPDEAVYLPGRNVLLAAKSSVWCRLRGVETLAFGILKGNPFPDSSPVFFEGLSAVLNQAMTGRLRIIRPFDGLSKIEVLARGAGLPLQLTFSCINPVTGRHCGVCNKCWERRVAFRKAGVVDLTEYAANPADTLQDELQACIE